MKHIWFIFSQIVFGLALAACGVAVAPPKVAPTAAPMVVTQVATSAPTEQPAPTAAAVVPQVATVRPTEKPTPTKAAVVTQVATVAPTEKPTPTEAPASAGPQAGDAAPDFSLPDSTGAMVHLADEIKMAHRAVVLVFYFDYT